MSRKFTNDFKTTIIELYNFGKSVTELASEYGISTQVIYKWLKESKSEPKTKIPENEELLALRKENQRLKTENEILKKATAIFAKKEI